MSSDIISKSLEKLGLSDFTISVYQELLHNQDHDISSLAFRLNTYRSKIYNSLDELKNLGLILGKTQDYSRQIVLENPIKISTSIRQQQSKLNLLVNELDEYLPQIQNQYYSSKKQPITKVYQGITQFKNFFDQVLEETEFGGEILVIGDGQDFEDIITAEYFLQSWMQRRLEKSIKVRILAKYFNQRLKSIMKNNEIELRETKFLNQAFNQPGCLWVTKNKVINWNTVLPKAIVIEDQIMAKFYQVLFEGMWQLQN